MYEFSDEAYTKDGIKFFEWETFGVETLAISEGMAAAEPKFNFASTISTGGHGDCGVSSG